jgi:transcriptional regulator of acetoin/glycerol metabolism
VEDNNDQYLDIPQPFKAKSATIVEDDRNLIRESLEKTYGNKTAAARLLGISRVTLYNKIRKYGLESWVKT